MDTPLHVACSNGYVDIVRYLLGQGANCYIENKKKETATIIAKSSSSLYDVFCNHLVLDYTGKESGKIDLPTMTIANELSLTNYDRSSAKNNCVWEFKPLHQQHWQVFMEKESNELSTNLRDKSDMRIDLDIQGQIYTISMMKFLKEVNSQNLNENQAWIRCRGSNIYNFDVISLWQMMLIMHPSITNKIHQEPQLKTITVPSIFDRNQFAYHLNSWYNADEIISKSIDEAINQRLRYLTINTRLLGRIIFNLELFSFTNESKTIQGYLRWLPKFVNFDMKAKRMTPVDNFQAIDLQNNPPIPLRNKLLREFSAIHDQTTESSKISDENNDSSQSDDVMPDVTDHFNDNETEEKKEYIEDVSLLSVQTEVDTKFQCNSDEELIIVEIEPNNSAMIENIQNNIREKRNDLNRENAKVKHYEQIVQKEQNLLMEIDKKKKEMEPQQNLISKLCESLSNPPVSEEFISLQKEYEKQEKILKLRMDELNNIKQDYDQLQHDLTIEQNKVRQFQNLQREEEQAVKELIQIKYNIPSTEHVQLQPTMVENYLRTLIYPEKIHENTVVAISTATGSGKSTLLPPLLVAAGYEKILITQPRRLPCNLLSKRVNSSMDSSSLSGWAVSGARSSNVLRAPILYLTDGLLKEYLLYRERYLIQQAEISKHGLVFFVDEVHERSINIDLCLTLLARFLEKNPSIHSKLKIIISSATLDPSIARIFRPFKLYEMKLETSTLHQVDRKPPCAENIIDLVSRLNQQLESNEQILCFVKSAQEVTQLIKLLKLVKGLPAFPLVQSQPSSEQQKLIETKHIFFSTTVAETSLTFPSLKYVIDTGLIHMPVYDPSTDTTELCELNAAESTVKQRQGRLGRTRSGEYYPLYTFNPSDKKFPVPQICQTELVQIEFSLRKSPLGCGFDHLKRWMPNPPSEQAIDAANKRLHQLDILDKHKYFTAIGVSISKLPDFGNIAMSKAVLIGLEKYNCGRDIIRLAAFLGVLNTSSILRSIPARYTKAEGDFMTLLTVMDAVLAQKLIQPPHLFDIDDACKQTNLGGITHILQRAVLRYESFENFFSSSKEYRAAAQCSSNGDWESIARALLEGYSDNVYLSLAEIQGRKHYYLRYTVPNTTEKQRKAVLDSTSKLARPLSAQPISLVLARDIRVSTDIRARSILSILGEIQPDWLDRALERDIPLTNKEIQKYNEEIKSSPDFMTISSNIVCSLSGRQLTLSGQAGCVLATELHIRNKLVVKYTTQIISEDEIDKSLKQNVENLIDTLHIFLPMVWRWKAEKQVKIRFLQTKKEGEIVIKARDEDYEKVRKELDSFVGWLRPCKSLHLHPGLSPRRFIDPQTKQPSSDIESRIRRITDITQTSVDLWPRVRGPAATRETRMEVVAWTAVCHFHCKLEGGFIRDWVVANQSARPPLSTPRQQWVQFQNNIPAIDKGLIPSDLDCHLPIDHHFDIDRFLDEMHKFEISTEVYRQHWRYILLFDRDYPTGPFTMDLIEPHVALTHNRIDFDVNNLYVMREFCAELGQRVNLHDPPFSIDLEEIVQKIKSKQFRVLRPIDNIVQTRIDKMLARGWQKTEEDLNYIPPPQNNFKFVLDPLPQNYQLYQQVENAMKQIPNVKILSIEQIRNPVVYETYHAMKKLITGQCPDGNPNECYLFHGTYTNNAESIMTMGFDDRYFSKNGLYGKP
ncbi:unnamed protein product [Rotaria sp. Silwood1]|nr:unnamed protein product [Rotaria sp. Silwood1]